MTSYVCMNCNYKFKADNAITCPYCSKRSIEKEKSAEELLTEIESLIE